MVALEGAGGFPFHFRHHDLELATIICLIGRQNSIKRPRTQRPGGNSVTRL